MVCKAAVSIHTVKYYPTKEQLPPIGFSNFHTEIKNMNKKKQI